MCNTLMVSRVNDAPERGAARGSGLRPFVAAMVWVLAATSCGEAPQPPGAHNDAVLEARAPGMSQAHLTAGCDFAGTWAVKFDIDVKWNANMGIQSGSGIIEQWALVTRRMVDGQTIEESVRPCGSNIPTYRSKAIYGGEEYGVGFPNDLFDTGRLPELLGTTHISGSAPGDTYSIEPIPLTLGVNLPDPHHDVWPKAPADLAPYLTDSDQDGEPGVTAVARDDGTLVLPPMNLQRSNRAKKFYIALRNLIGARGTIISCDRFEGNARVVKLGGKPALNSAILGCELTDANRCSKTMSSLANTFQPAYQVGNGSRSVMVRVGAQTSCPEVRALNF